METNNEKELKPYKRELTPEEQARLDRIRQAKEGRISKLGEFMLSGMTYGEILDMRAVLK